MADKQFKCPTCQKMTTVKEDDYNEIIEKAGEASAVTFLATILTLPFGGVGGLLAGVYYSAKGIYNYASINCSNERCGARFPIARWTDGDAPG